MGACWAESHHRPEHISQEKTMNQSATAADLSRALTEAWTRHDPQIASGYIADVATFDGPVGHAEGKTAYRQWASKPLGFSQGMNGPLPVPGAPPCARNGERATRNRDA